MMQLDRQMWPAWARIIQQGGIKQWVSFLLEAGGPLTVLIAQLIYIGQPMLNQTGSQNQWLALAELLEDQEKTRSFAAYLREENIQ
jgi:hypothetical protein